MCISRKRSNFAAVKIDYSLGFNTSFMSRILIVDDEDDICQILSYSLQTAGYQTLIAHSAEEAIPLVRTSAPDLILLDIMLDGMSGTQMAAYLRDEGLMTMPVIFLTALGGENDVLKGFQLGADDYITKPFRITEVLARVAAVLKRAGGHTEAQTADTLTYQGIVINHRDKSLTVDGTPISITRKELELLSFLLTHQGQMLSRSQLLTAVWHDDSYVLERTVDVHITHLRRKIGAYAEHLQTKSGFGYIWRP